MLVALNILGFFSVSFLLTLSLRIYDKMTPRASIDSFVYGGVFFLWPVLIALALVVIPVILLFHAGHYVFYKKGIEGLSTFIVSYLRTRTLKKEQAKREAKKFHDDEMRVVNDYRK